MRPRDEARTRHRSRHLRGLSRLRDRVQGVERLVEGERRAFGLSAVRRRAVRRVVQPRAPLRGRRLSGEQDDQLSRCRACTAPTPTASPCVRPARRTSAPTASCSSIRTSAWAATCAPGRARTARASWTRSPGTMKKCTLCVDRIYDELLAAGGSAAGLRARLPDARAACSAISTTRIPAVSRVTAERGGFGLMPELGYAPVNRYLPPRAAAAGARARRDPRRCSSAAWRASRAR